MLALTGWTPGAGVARIRLVDARTGRPSALGVFLHADLTLVSVVPTLGLGAVALMRSASSDPQGRAWHDHFSGIKVVDATAGAEPAADPEGAEDGPSAEPAPIPGVPEAESAVEDKPATTEPAAEDEPVSDVEPEAAAPAPATPEPTAVEPVAEPTAAPVDVPTSLVEEPAAASAVPPSAPRPLSPRDIVRAAKEAARTREDAAAVAVD